MDYKKYIFGKKKKQTNSLLLYFMFQVVKSQKMIVLDFSTYLKIYIFKNSPRIKGGEHYEEEFKLAQGPGLDQRKTLKWAYTPPTPPTHYHHTNFFTSPRVHRKSRVSI